jgi:hypothetical protein
MQGVLVARMSEVAFEVMSSCDMALQALTVWHGHVESNGGPAKAVIHW